MFRKHHREIHSCTCESCVTQPQGEIAEEHRAINRLVASMDEQRRRRFVGFLAHQHGRGGTVSLARITGLSPKTIRRAFGRVNSPLRQWRTESGDQAGDANAWNT